MGSERRRIGDTIGCGLNVRFLDDTDGFLAWGHTASLLGDRLGHPTCALLALAKPGWRRGFGTAVPARRVRCRRPAAVRLSAPRPGQPPGPPDCAGRCACLRA